MPRTLQHLPPGEILKNARHIDQCLIVADLRNPALVHDDDPIRVHDGGEPRGDDHQTPCLKSALCARNPVREKWE
jgi:hypothetical protein